MMSIPIQLHNGGPDEPSHTVLEGEATKIPADEGAIVTETPGPFGAPDGRIFGESCERCKPNEERRSEHTETERLRSSISPVTGRVGRSHRVPSADRGGLDVDVRRMPLQSKVRSSSEVGSKTRIPHRKIACIDRRSNVQRRGGQCVLVRVRNLEEG
jgi:hypothetical protein